MLVEIGVILVLVLAGGVFVGSELAIVSARTGRLEELSADGNRGAAVALRLRDMSNHFLAMMQIAMTLISTTIGVLGGAFLADRLGAILAEQSTLAPFAYPLALALVVLGISYIKLVLGETVPRRLASQNPETIATRLAGSLAALVTLSRPFIGVLEWSTTVVVTLLGQRQRPETGVTEEDIRELVHEGTQEGSVDPEEERFIQGVFQLGERTVRQIMTPRIDVSSLSANSTVGEILDEVLELGYSRFPVYEGNSDDIIGVIHVRNLLQHYRLHGEHVKVREAMFPPTIVPEHTRASRLLAIFRKNQRHLAIVVSDLGSVEGVVTMEDVLEEIVGDILDESDEIAAQAVVVCEDGSLLMDGTLPVGLLKQRLEVDELPEEAFYQYDTLAGFMLSLIGRIPRPGETVSWEEWRFEVVEMDGLRIERVRVRKEAPAPEQEEQSLPS